MRRILIPFLLFALAGCAEAPPPPAAAPSSSARRVGDGVFLSVQWLQNLPQVTGISQTYTLWDSTVGYTANTERVMFSGFYDQPVTILYNVKNTGASSWRTINGAGHGDTVAASTPTSIDYFMLGPQNQIQLVTGGTPPVTNETSLGLVFERTLGMFQ